VREPTLARRRTRTGGWGFGWRVGHHAIVAAGVAATPRGRGSAVQARTTTRLRDRGSAVQARTTTRLRERDGTATATLDSGIVSHPSLGLPPLSLTAGSPEAAARIRASAQRLAAQALTVAMRADSTVRDRHDEAGQRHLLHAAELLAERVALAVASGNPSPTREYAEWTSIVYRRKAVPMDDLIALCEGLRSALPGVLATGELPAANAALEAAIEVYRWHRRLAGDARKRNRLLRLLYKGG